MGATPSFKGYHGFPASICACINDEVVHGIPRKHVIHRGDLLKVDTGAYYEGFHGDSCITIAVGEVSPQARRLMMAAEAALSAGIEQVKPGNTLMDIAGAIEDCVKRLRVYRGRRFYRARGRAQSARSALSLQLSHPATAQR